MSRFIPKTPNLPSFRKSSKQDDPKVQVVKDAPLVKSPADEAPPSEGPGDSPSTKSRFSMPTLPSLPTMSSIPLLDFQQQEWGQIEAAFSTFEGPKGKIGTWLKKRPSTSGEQEQAYDPNAFELNVAPQEEEDDGEGDDEAAEVEVPQNTPSDSSPRSPIPTLPKSLQRLMPSRKPRPVPGLPSDQAQVYLVMRPVEPLRDLLDKMKGFNQKAGEVGEHAGILLAQHWGIEIGDNYYHLKKLEKSNVEGTTLVPGRLALDTTAFEKVILRIPLWGTDASPADRVEKALAVLAHMGGYDSSSDVPIVANEQVIPRTQLAILPPDSPTMAKIPKSMKSSGLVRVMGKLELQSTLAGNEYNVLLNNCHDFAARYISKVSTNGNIKTRSLLMARIVQAWVVEGQKLGIKTLLQVLQYFFSNILETSPQHPLSVMFYFLSEKTKKVREPKA